MDFCLIGVILMSVIAMSLRSSANSDTTFFKLGAVGSLSLRRNGVNLRELLQVQFLAFIFSGHLATKFASLINKTRFHSLTMSLRTCGR
jgi:hypothetical protein